MTFKALCDVVRSQGIALKEIERNMPQRISKAEISSNHYGKLSSFGKFTIQQPYYKINYWENNLLRGGKSLKTGELLHSA